MASLETWVAGARPKTLPAAIVPVVVGSGVAMHGYDFSFGRAWLALMVSLLLQIGVNYANDYSDGVRGTDQKRTGPVRLVGQGLVEPEQVKRAAFLCFGLAMLLGFVLSIISNPLLIVVGALCVVAAWYYTGGSNPYGYSGLGEVSVFVFFGLVAVMGTAYVQIRHVTLLAFVASIPVGLLAVALLVVNNLRDINTDADTGKRTLAVRLGASRTRLLYAACISGPFVAAALIALSQPAVLVVLLAIPLAVIAARPVVHKATGRELITVLQATGRLQLAFGALLAIGLAV